LNGRQHGRGKRSYPPYSLTFIFGLIEMRNMLCFASDAGFIEAQRLDENGGD
jgi:hypothetical protein